MFNFFNKDKKGTPASAEIFLQNNLTGKKEVFSPVKKGELKMYNCGPTVYGPVHIGNLRPYVFADTLRRLFEYQNYKVLQVINITDVGHLTSDADEGEDKLEKAAKERGERAAEIAQKYTDFFMNEIERLNIDTSKIIFPKATDHITEQLKLIKKLEVGGYTYKTSDGIYFNTEKFKDYGVLGGVANTIKAQKESKSRIQENAEKKSPFDFALWKFSNEKDGQREQEWNSPWGVGFPGWHLECSAMSVKYLGQPFDIHTGGVDHIQIHHNNEIAQSQAANGKPQANYWLHSNHINISGERIAKSVGNTTYLDDLEKKKINPLSYKYWLLTSHYSTLVNFTDEAVSAADKAFNKLIKKLAEIKNIDGAIDQNYIDKILKNINDDLNTSAAIAEIWNLIKDDSVLEEDKLLTILEADKLLGLNIQNLINKEKEKNGKATKPNDSIPMDVIRLADHRKSAREHKDFELADEIRAKINKMGYEIVDEGEDFHLKIK
jgi:cysteinyl-tRNA synthetase